MSDEYDGDIQSVIMPINLIVMELVNRKGLDLVTEVGKPETFATVAAWIDGSAIPSAEQAQRLRNASAMLSQVSDQEKISADGAAGAYQSALPKTDPIHFESSISDTGYGVFLVTTRGGVHLIDLDARTVQRFRRTGAEYETAELRRDGEQVKLLRLLSCTVGSGLTMVVDLNLDPPRPTLRPSTDVVSIVRVIG